MEAVSVEGKTEVAGIVENDFIYHFKAREKNTTKGNLLTDQCQEKRLISLGQFI